MPTFPNGIRVRRQQWKAVSLLCLPPLASVVPIVFLIRRFLIRPIEFYLILYFLLHSLAVFREAAAFNQDVSKWNTGAVTTMELSKCNLSNSLSPRLPLLCICEYDFRLITIFTLFCLFLERSCFSLWVVLCFLCCTHSCSVQ